MKLTFVVDHINDGPTPFDVTATADDGTGLRLRFDAHPGVIAGDEISVEFEQEHLPVEPEPDVEPEDVG